MYNLHTLQPQGKNLLQITTHEFLQNPTHFQTLADKEPIIVENGEQKQILMNYSDFLKLNPQKPAVSLYDVFANVPDELREALLLIDDDIEEDFSFQSHRYQET